MIFERQVKVKNGYMTEAYAKKHGVYYSESDIVQESKASIASEAMHSLNDDELEQISRLVALYQRMKEAKKFDISDKLRQEIKHWDSSLQVLETGRIHTWFESPQQWKDRIVYRVAKGGDLPYPYQSLAEVL